MTPNKPPTRPSAATTALTAPRRPVMVPAPTHAAEVTYSLSLPASAAPGSRSTPPPDAARGLAEPYRTIHHALRGRYRWVAALGILGAVAGGWMGMKRERPQYRSEALVRIAYTLPPVIQETDQNRPMAMFEAFLQSQRLMLGSRRLVERAMADPAWRATGRPAAGAAAAAEFVDGLDVQHQPGTEMLRIAFTDVEAQVAATAVRAVVQAYSDEYRLQETRFQEQRIKALDERRDELLEKMKQTRGQIARIATEFGSADIREIYDAAVRRLTTLEQKLTDLRIALATGDGVASGDRIQALTPEQIALIDPVMRALVVERTTIETRLKKMEVNLGSGHLALQAQLADLQDVNDRIDKYAELFKSFQGFMRQNRGSLNASVPQPAPLVDEFRENERRLESLRDDAKREMASLGAKRLEIERLNADVQNISTELAQIESRRESLRVESMVSGRLSVVSQGETPLRPTIDRRPKFAAAGAAAGAVFPGALIGLLGVVRQRCRFPDEAEADAGVGARLLGIVPAVPRTWRGDAEAVVAARCVQLIRLMLQNARVGDATQAITFTSAASGDGKTSVCLSVAYSFAAAGAETLVIDADIDGRRLSSGFELNDADGFYQAMRTGVVDGCFTHVGRGLNVMPVGAAEGSAEASISPSAVRRVLDDARRRFDVVLVDTGPVLGGVEASVVAPECEGVVFVISRGQQSHAVSQALRRLQSVGAARAGIVFNRLRSQDLDRSGYVSAPSPSRASRAGSRRSAQPPPGTCLAFGPLVRAVTARLPASETSAV